MNLLPLKNQDEKEFPQDILHSSQNTAPIGLIRPRIVIGILARKSHEGNKRCDAKIPKLIRLMEEVVEVEYGIEQFKQYERVSKNQTTWAEDTQERFRTRNLKLHNQVKSFLIISSNKKQWITQEIM